MLIRKKLPLMIIVLVSIPLLLLSLVIYYFTSISITDSSKKNIQQVTSVEGNALTTYINSQVKEVQLSARRESIVEMLKNRSKSKDLNSFVYTPEALNVDRNLASRVEELNDLQHSFICDVQGNIIADSDSEGIKLNISYRKYFQKVMGGEIAVSDAMKSAISNENIVVAACPVLDEQGNVIGLFGNSIKVQSISDYLSNIKIGNTGYAYLTDNNGILIAHPTKSKVGTLVDNPVILNVVKSFDKINISVTKMDTYTYNNQKKYLGYIILPYTNWILAVAQNVQEVNAPARLELYIIVGLTIFMIIVSALVSLIASKSIANPIEKLIATINKAENGDLTVICDYESKNELGQLSHNLNNMIKKLNGSYEELSSVYEELSSTEEELRSQYDQLLENQKALALSEDRYKEALDGINDAVWEWNVETNEFFASDKWQSITGYSNKKVDFIKLLHLLVNKNNLNEINKEVILNNRKLKDDLRQELEITTGNGEKKWILTKSKITRNSEGKLLKIVGSISDISSTKKADDKIKQLALFDALTGIPNRYAFLNSLDKEVSECSLFNKQGAIFFIDLDDFKRINDSLGHDIGDKLLKTISSQAMALIDKNETICRFGGDEFLVLKRNINGKEEIIELANKLLSIFKDCFVLDGKQVFITCSIGICMFPNNGKDKNIILKNADTAMYKAKEQGKNRYEFYNEEMSEKLMKAMVIEKAIRNGLINNDFYLNYQPQVDIQTGNIIGVESLIRLKNEELGFLSPGEFIPIAEEDGLIVPIGDWVMETALTKKKEWIDKGYGSVRMSINVSSLQIHQPDFLEKVKCLVDKFKIPKGFIELEITESVLMESLDDNVRILQELRNIGIRTALDDFGTGYSSLNYLRMIPIDTLKIDKSFIDDICTNEKQGAIVDVIIEMAHKLGMEVIAEGIETVEQLKVMKEKNCDVIQGYVFSKPLSAGDVEHLLEKGAFDIK